MARLGGNNRRALNPCDDLLNAPLFCKIIPEPLNRPDAYCHADRNCGRRADMLQESAETRRNNSTRLVTDFSSATRPRKNAPLSIQAR
jgi:hypothetical protein